MARHGFLRPVTLLNFLNDPTKLNFYIPTMLTQKKVYSSSNKALKLINNWNNMEPYQVESFSLYFQTRPFVKFPLIVHQLKLYAKDQEMAKSPCCIVDVS